MEEKSEAQVARGEVDTEKSLLLFSRSFPISGAIRHKGPVGNPNRKPSFIFLNPTHLGQSEVPGVKLSLVGVLLKVAQSRNARSGLEG